MADFIFRYRWAIIIACLLTGAGSIALLPLLKTDPEIRNYVPASIPSRTRTDRIEKEFGVQDMVVVLFSDSCILNKDNLQQIKNIDKGISRISGVSSRVSPFTVRTIRNEDGAMAADPLIGQIPDDQEGMRELAGKVDSGKFARDVVISSDLTAASIAATINGSEPEGKTISKIDSVITANPGKAKILTGGLPYIRQNILRDVKKDAIYLVPLALLIMLLVLKANLGSWRSVMMPFSVVFLATAFSMALLPLAGWKMSIITLLVPVILIAVANNYGIYLASRYQELKMANPGSSRIELVRQLLGSLNMPILFSGLTTIAGILGLLTHSIIPARQVGVLAASGVTLALLMSLLLIPALIFAGGDRMKGSPQSYGSGLLFRRMLDKLSAAIIRYPGRILLVSLIITVVMSSGAVLLKINTNQENYFPQRTAVRQASNLISSKFGGSQTISIMVSGDIEDPEIMKGIDRITTNLEKEKGVGKVFSISQAVREMSKAIYTSGEYGYDRIPDSRDAIAQMFELYNMSGSPDDFKQLMNLDNTRAHILVRLSDPENSVIRALKARIPVWSATIPAEVTVGGYALIMADFAESIIRGQAYSLIFAVVSVLMLLAIIFRSVKGGLIGSIPLVASIGVLFGFMGFAGIALDAATALLSSLMIGVGVDFTIQYIWCFNLQVGSGLSYPEATAAAMKTIGRSIIINALSVMAGFSALMFSGFTSIRFFGYLVVISIGSCLIGAIVIIPAILIKYRPGFIGFKTINTRKKKHEKESDHVNIPAAAFASRSATA